MAILLTLKGPHPGRQFTLRPDCSILGRHVDANICLESQAVSRHHARVLCEEGNYFIEDLKSSNGTFVNGKRIIQRVLLTEKDSLQIGPYLLGLRHVATPSPPEEDLVIREQISASASSLNLYAQDPAHKLQVVLEISQSLACTLDLDQLLGKLLVQLMKLFPQADRGMVLLLEGNQLVVRAQRGRRAIGDTTYAYSRTVVHRALDEGVGLLSEDVRSDQRFLAGSSLTSLDLRSVLCIPLISLNGTRLGVVQLDRRGEGKSFASEDLQLLTTIGLQVSVVLENVALHAEVLREERLHQELAMAREIQQGFLPDDFPDPEVDGYELFARVWPAREVSGDLYDFFPLPNNRLAFFIGDVSGKGMPAALFMVAVRTLGRYLASSGASPAETLARLNTSLAADNPSGMFVTINLGIYNSGTGEIVFATAGHPLPLLRRADGQVEQITVASGRLLGYETGNLNLNDFSVKLAAKETFILYTDGFTEARSPDGKTMFEIERVERVFGGEGTSKSLAESAEQARSQVETFTGKPDLQDDLTLFLLRRT